MGRLTARRRVRRVDTRAVTPPGPKADPTARPTGPAAGTAWVDAVDQVAVEEPLELRLNGENYAVTMRTPGHDVELAHGWLYAEGIIADAADVGTARYCPGATVDLATGTPTTGANSYNVLDLTLAQGVAPAATRARALVTSSACGVCGTRAIADLLAGGLPDLRDDPTAFDALMVAGLPDGLRKGQRVFGSTGGVHAAGLCSADGTPLVVREDVGRHNAVDKTIGWALLAGRLPGRGLALVVSGRASYELVQKAVRARVPLLVAVSAPSSLAVDLAQSAGLTLVAFSREGRFTAYSHADRITG